MPDFQKYISQLPWEENLTPMHDERKKEVHGVVWHSASQIILGKPASEFMRENRFSYHALIHPINDDNPKGLIEVTCPRKFRAWHAGESRWEGETHLNHSYIGFCVLIEGEHVHQAFFDRIKKPEAFTAFHYEALAMLTVQAMLDYPKITLSRIIRHSDCSGLPVRPKNPKHDPGSGFNYTHAINRVRFYLDLTK